MHKLAEFKITKDDVGFEVYDLFKGEHGKIINVYKGMAESDSVDVMFKSGKACYTTDGFLFKTVKVFRALYWDKPDIIEPKRRPQRKLLWNNSMKKIELNSPENKWGFMSIERASVVIEALVAGKKLWLDHEGFGMYKVEMNPQRNVILVHDVKGKRMIGRDEDDWQHKIKESEIESYMLWDHGDWYEEIP